MKPSIIVAFGKPGAGKSYVAGILEKRFGYLSYNGDDALPPVMKEKLFQKAEITEDMRNQFLINMIEAVKKLSQEHKNIVIHQTFLKEYMRKKFIEALPRVTFLLVECDDAVRETRYLKRSYFNLGLSYLRQMTKLFEPVHIPHEMIINNEEGPEEITKQLQNIIDT